MASDEGRSERCGFWTVHELNGRAVDASRQPPGETELSGLARGAVHVDGSDGPTVWVLREVFDSFEEGRAWLDEVFHRTDWDEYLAGWSRHE